MAARVTPGMQNTMTQAQPGAPSVPVQVAQTLQQLGLVKGGNTPLALSQNLLGALHAQGFGSALGAFAQQLSAALSAFQRQNGLPPTGQLDQATAALLQKSGLLPTNANASGGVLNVKDGFESARPQADGGAQGAATAKGDASLQQLLQGVVKAAVEGSQRAMEFLSGLLGFGGGALAAGGQAGEIGQGNAAQGGAKESAAGQGAGRSTTEGKGDESARNDGSAVGQQLAGFVSKSNAEGKARSKSGLKDAKLRGVDEEDEGEQGLEDGEGKGTSQGEGEGGEAEEGAEGRGEQGGDEGGSERWVGNASSGDTNKADKRRGKHMLDELAESAQGHYQMPAVAEQWRLALDRIFRDHDEANRTTTYTWDVRFYRPGVYGPGQKAEVILHLAVKEATAFDRAWNKSVDALTSLVERFDGPDVDVPVKEDMLRAIRRARVA